MQINERILLFLRFSFFFMALIECYSKGIASAVVIALRLPRDNEPTVDNETVNIFMQMFSANSEVNNEEGQKEWM